MPIDPKDLEARLAAATPADTARGLTFNAVFETLDEHLGAEAARACDPAGKGKRNEFLSYPVTDYLAVAWKAADALSPRLGSADDAFRAFGYRTTSGVLASTIGRTLLSMVGRAGLRGVLAQAPTAYRSMVSYGDRRLEWVAERHARFVFTRDFSRPAFHLGVFQAAADSMGVTLVTLAGRPTGLLDAVVDVAWEDAGRKA